MKKPALIFFYAAFLTLLALAAPAPAAAEGQTDGRETAWEELLPQSARGEAFEADGAGVGQTLEAFLEKRENAAPNPALQGKNIIIHGFVVPLERDENGDLTEFLLAPYFGACIHVPPPPQNQIIHVTLARPAKGVQSMDAVFVRGAIMLESVASPSGDAAYGIKGAEIERQTAISASRTVAAICLTLICGMSVCLGWVGPFTAIRLEPRLAGAGMAFAAGAMACLGLTAASVNLSVKNMALFFAGAALMLGLELMLHGPRRHASAPAQGQAWAGHSHRGLGPALAVALHNFPECFIVFSGAMANAGLGLALGAAMVAHNVPLGISIAQAWPGLSAGQAWARAAAAGVAPPAAAMLGYFFLRPLLSPEAVRMLFSCAGGALVFIALADLLPLARRHGKSGTTCGGFAAGALLLFFILMYSYNRG